jgi:hypothetical protein
MASHRSGTGAMGRCNRAGGRPVIGDPLEVEDCWILTARGRRPGLITARRWSSDGRTARVAYITIIAGRWQLVEQWLPQDTLEFER